MPVFDPSNRPLEPDAELALVSTLTCPTCGAQASETMATNACRFFYDCPSCGVRLKPKPGQCCVFCSFGTVPCPPAQAATGFPHPSPDETPYV